VIKIFCLVVFIGCESGNALGLRIITLSSFGPDLFLPAIGNKARTSLGIFPRQPFVSLPFCAFNISAARHLNTPPFRLLPTLVLRLLFDTVPPFLTFDELRSIRFCIPKES